MSRKVDEKFVASFSSSRRMSLTKAQLRGFVSPKVTMSAFTAVPTLGEEERSGLSDLVIDLGPTVVVEGALRGDV